MYATLRYYQVNDADAIARNVNEEFLDIVRQVPGFSAYHVVASAHPDGDTRVVEDEPRRVVLEHAGGVELRSLVLVA
jgi:hypothetical protein